MVGRLATLSAVLAALAQAAPPKSVDPIIHVNPRVTYQKYDGIGVSEAFQRSLVLHELNTASQNLALDYLFSNVSGAGMTILRNGLGSSPTDPFDHMKSIAPTAPRSNSSHVGQLRKHVMGPHLRFAVSSTTFLYLEMMNTRSGCLRRPLPEVSKLFTPTRGVLMAT